MLVSVSVALVAPASAVHKPRAFCDDAAEAGGTVTLGVLNLRISTTISLADW